jgi:hypothetical protein
MGKTLVQEIEAGALDPHSDLASVLRKCIALGGETGSTRLRDWASLELKGYGSTDELPDYRLCPPPQLLFDGADTRKFVRGQALSPAAIPEFARAALRRDIEFRQGVAALIEIIESNRRDNESFLRLGVPGGENLVALMNHRIAEEERETLGFAIPGVGPSRMIERIYWSLPISVLVTIIDVVRTTLVELVTEMRAGMPKGAEIPSEEVTEQAVEVAIKGNRNRVTVVNQAGAGIEAAVATGGTTNTGGGPPEPRSRRVMWWIVGIAGIAGAVAAIGFPTHLL